MTLTTSDPASRDRFGRILMAGFAVIAVALFSGAAAVLGRCNFKSARGKGLRPRPSQTPLGGYAPPSW